MKTVVGLYDDISDARDVVQDLDDSGFDRDDISLVASDRDRVYGRQIEDRDTDTGNEAGEGAAAGAVSGGIIGGIAGVLLGLGTFFIPGLGWVVAAGPIVAGLTGAGIGAVAGGLLGALIGWGIPEEQAGYYAEGVRRGGTLVAVRTPENRVDDAVDIMNQHDPIDIERRAAYWREEGWTGYDTEAEAYTTDEIETERENYTAYETETTPTTRGREVEEEAIPIVEEEMRVGKREVERGGVRVHAYVEEQPVSEDVQLREERVHVERRPVDRRADVSDLDTFEEKTIEMTERGEEVVAEKTARVIEEVVIEKDVDVHEETVRDTVRRTRVDTEEIGEYDEYAPQFRKHYETTYADTDYNYKQYEPAYRYGYNLASSDRYYGRDWNEIEPEVRTRWEETNKGTWNDFRGAVRHGWNRVQTRPDRDRV